MNTEFQAAVQFKFTMCQNYLLISTPVSSSVFWESISIILISFYVHGKPVCHAVTVDISGLAFDSALPRSVHRQLVIHYRQMEARFLLLPSSLRWVEAVMVCSIKMLAKKLAWGLISHWLYISMNGKPSELEDQRDKWSGCVWRKIQSPDVKSDDFHNTEDPRGSRE